MPWYRRPEEEETLEGGRRGRGRGRARGRARGRGRGCPPQEPPPHLYTMGPPGPYAPPPYYHNPSGMEEMLPHWQYVLRAQQESHRTPNPAMLGPQRFPTRRDAHAGPSPYENYEAAVNRGQFNPGGFMDFHLAAQHAQTIQGGLAQSPGFHHPIFSHATHARYTNQISTQQKGPQQRVDKRTGKKNDSSKEKQASSARTEVSQKLSSSKISSLVNPQAPNGDPTHHLTDLVATMVSRPEAPKTLDETAAFLNHPQLVLQKNKFLSTSDVAPQNHATSDALSQTAIIARDSSQASQLLLSQKQDQAKSARDGINVRYDRATSSQIPDFRKYSELSVTIADVEPPPAHQASVAKTCLPYPELHTPPLAHQAPASHAPAQPQSARLHAIPSPPPAHQSSTTHSIQYAHPSHLNEQTSVNFFSPQARQVSIVKATANNIVTTTHATYDRHQILRKAQLIYEPSTETIAAENVLYRPEKDLLTKEQVVYQRNNIMFAKTEIVYKDVIASAEALYESDKVTARETVIQRPAGAMEAATQQNVTSALKSMQHTATLYRQEAEIVARSRSQAFVEAEHRSRSEAFAQMIVTDQNYTKALVESKHRSRSDDFAHMIAEQKSRTQALIEAEHRSRSNAFAQMIAAEQTYTKALVEAETRSRSEAFAHLIAEQQTRTRALVEAEHQSQSDAFSQIMAAEQTYTKALVEAEHRSRSVAFAQKIAEQKARTQALVEAEQRSRSEAFAQMIAAEQIYTKALVEAEQRSQNDAYAQIIAAEQMYAKSLVEAQQRSRNDAFAQMITEERPRSKQSVKTEHLSRSDAFAEMIAARQIRTRALNEAEHRPHLQSTVDTQAQHRNNYLKETKVHEDSLGNSPHLHESLSNEHEQDESTEAKKNLEMLQLLLHCNALNNPSNSVTQSRTLRETRKRKRSSTQASRAAQAPPPLPSTSRAPAADFQALLALNWSLQNLPASRQAAPPYTEYLRDATNNDTTTDASDGDDD